MMTKKKSLQDTHHTPSHKIIPQTESDELSQGNSQKKFKSKRYRIRRKK